MYSIRFSKNKKTVVQQKLLNIKLRTAGKHTARVSYPVAWLLCHGPLTLPFPKETVRDAKQQNAG